MAVTFARGMVVVIVVAVCLMLVKPSRGQQPFTVGSCAAATQYFDTTDVTCGTCDAATGRTPDTDALDALGFPSACECQAGYIVEAASCLINSFQKCGPPTCTSCLTGGNAASRDHTRCMPCGASTNGLTIGSDIDDCTCAADFALVETSVTGDPLASKECVACPNGTHVFTTATGDFAADRYTCQSCPDPNMEFDASFACTCKTGFTAAGVASMTGVQCIADDRLAALASFSETKVEYFDVRTSSGGSTTATVEPSLTFSDLYMKSAVACYNWEDESSNKACQALSNMCVLRMYNRDAKPCALLLDQLALRGGSVNGWASWVDTLPMLYYSLDRGTTVSTITNTLDLTAVMSFDESAYSGTHEWLQFKLVRFSTDGTFLGITDLANQFLYCDNTAAASPGRPDFLRYGHTVTQTAECDLTSLFSAGPGEFLDLYVVDYAGTTVTEGLPVSIYPVPVRIINYREGSATPNVNSELADEENDELVRRFFLYDIVSGIQTAGANPTYMRFAETITLTVPAQKDETARILPPVLTIKYGVRQVSSLATDSDLRTATITFNVQYTTDLDSFWTVAVVLLALALVLVVMVCCLRMFNWCGRSTRSRAEQVLTFGVLVRTGVVLAGTFGRVVFWLVVGLCGYWLIFFKLQDSAFTLLPAEETHLAGNDYDVFNTMVLLCFFGQLVRICEIVWSQSQVDLFFVDWERDRRDKGRTREDHVLDTVAEVEEGKGVGPTGSGAGGAPKSKKRIRYPQVSAWRSILAANEFSEMQTVRKTSLHFTLLILLFFLRGVGLEYVATPQPNASDLTPGDTNPVLLFGLVSLLWLAINLLQVAWNFLVWERFVSEPATERFIDLLTLAKVSLLALDDKYHGYYLHCRSSHEQADANMAQLTHQLQLEAEKSKHMPRGLERCPDGENVQSFELFVTEPWRQHYDRILGKLARTRRENRDPIESNGIFALCMEPKRSKEDIKALLKASAQLLDFMKGFIDETNPVYPRRWNHRLWYFRVFNIPPEFVTGSAAIGDSSRIYGDPTVRWESIIFRGVEIDLMVFNILTFAIGMMAFDDTVVSTIWVFMVESAVVWVRLTLGMRNIASKALVDERFLK